MANPILILVLILALFFSSYSIHHIPGLNPVPTEFVSLNITTKLRTDPKSITIASNDYGNLVHDAPSAVLYPSSINDIIQLVELSYYASTHLPLLPEAMAILLGGQAMAHGGVVVNMASLRKNGSGIRVSCNPSLGYYADVGGEQLWMDVLRAGLEHGLAPVSWTDYLYLTVGGTLSNAGISAQSFLHGPQISNVLELDVVTGKGDFITCSKIKNSELFFGVLGGLGQFGIITRARIVLDRAPTRARWARLLYTNFSAFTRDQEHLISLNSPDYVEGFLVTNVSATNEWRSSFSSPSRQSDIASQWKKQSLLYSIELVKYYDNQTANTIDKNFGRYSMN